MKKLLLVLLMVTVGMSAFADGFSGDGEYENDDFLVYKEEAAEILKSIDDSPIGGFTLEEMKKLNLELSIPFQKMKYVKESEMASAVFPGFGQYMNDDPLGGTLFIVSNIAVITGTIIGAYYSLPDELRFNRLDYLNDSFSTINERWDNQSFVDMLPSMSVIAAGFVVDGIIRLLSASHAGKLAQENIANGKIQFEPKLILPSLVSSEDYDFGQSGYGLGMSMCF